MNRVRVQLTPNPRATKTAELWIGQRVRYAPDRYGKVIDLALDLSRAVIQREAIFRGERLYVSAPLNRIGFAPNQEADP